MGGTMRHRALRVKPRKSACDTGRISGMIRPDPPRLQTEPMRRLFRWLSGLAALPALYLMASVLLALVPGPGPDLSGPASRTIGLLQGPIHTDILLPLPPETRARFAFAETAGVPVNHPQAEWLVFGWGSAAFYTTAGTYADITASAILTAATGDDAVIRLDVLGRGLSYDFKLLADRLAPAPVPVTARLGLPEGTQMRYLETLHLAGERPFVLETRWLNPVVLPHPVPDFARVSANEWLVTHVSLVSGDIAFTAEPASPREAEVMGVAPGTALLIAERTTHGTAGPVTLVRLAHAPGHRVAMVF